MSWQQAATRKELARGPLRVELSGLPVLISDVEGEVVAVADTCTHEQASLREGYFDDGTVECPLHGARFDLRTGQPLCLPAVTPLTTFPVRLRGEVIEVDLEQKREESHG